MSEENYKFTFGKHKGDSITRVPVSYLRWMINQFDFSHGDIQGMAKKELDRRGSFLPELEISGHAIDKASTRCIKIWKNTRLKEEGLYTGAAVLSIPRGRCPGG